MATFGGPGWSGVALDTTGNVVRWCRSGDCFLPESVFKILAMISFPHCTGVSVGFMLQGIFSSQYVTDYMAVRKITPTGSVTTFADFTGDARFAWNMQLPGLVNKGYPKALAVDPTDDTIYLVDPNGQQIWRLPQSGGKILWAGNTTCSDASGGGSGTCYDNLGPLNTGSSSSGARFGNIFSIDIAQNGDVYVGDCVLTRQVGAGLFCQSPVSIKKIIKASSTVTQLWWIDSQAGAVPMIGKYGGVRKP